MDKLTIYECPKDEDQPIHCVFCGSRTEFDSGSNPEIHTCLGNPDHRFIVEYEKE